MTGDVEATEPQEPLGVLYARTVGASEALARGLTGDQHLAQDIAQEAFIKAAARLPFLRDPSSFDAYLRRTVVNLCRAHGRRVATERASYAKAQALARPGPGSIATEDGDALWDTLQTLPFRQRAAVVLRYYEDLSEAQTAQVLKCSERAVNALVSRAMATLRQTMEEER